MDGGGESHGRYFKKFTKELQVKSLAVIDATVKMQREKITRILVHFSFIC